MTRLLVLFLLTSSLAITVNGQDSHSYDSLIRKYISLQDYENGIILAKRGLAVEPDNKELNKDLVLCYYFQNNFDKAIDLLVKLINKNIADDQCFQVAGEIYKLQNLPKDAENIFQKGILRYPNNGPMYNEIANLLWEQKNENAISYWEKGIEMDPNYSKNYFNAAGYYSFKKNWLRTILHAEIFVNLESFSDKTNEVKELLLNAYKYMLIKRESDLIGEYKSKFSGFFIKNLFTQKELNDTIINTDELIKIRTRFILNWFDKSASPFPFKLFDYHLELLQNGLFEAYNQWLFGASDNLAVFHLWKQLHSVEYDEFIHLQKSRLFKIPTNQYYQ